MSKPTKFALILNKTVLALLDTMEILEVFY